MHVRDDGQELHHLRSLACWYSAARFASSSRRRPSRAALNSAGLLNPNCGLTAPKWTFRKLAGSPKSPVQPSRYSSAFPAWTSAQVVRPPRRAVERDLEARLLEARGERLDVPLRVRHVRPRDARRVPEVDRHRQRQAGLLEQLLRLVRVVRVVGHALRREADERRRQELVRHLPATGVERRTTTAAVERRRRPPAGRASLSIGGIVWLMPDVGDVERPGG